jgi:hypothetical protein
MILELFSNCESGRPRAPRPLRHGTIFHLTLIIFQHGDAQTGRQVDRRAARDLGDEIADGHVFFSDDGIEAVPESVFQADAGSPFSNDDRSLATAVKFHGLLIRWG